MGTEKLLASAKKQLDDIYASLFKENLWKRMMKCALASTITVIIVLLPGIRETFGGAAYLAGMTSVFGHPGRRLGAMAEALALVTIGTLVGIGWASLGIYLGGLLLEQNPSAMMTIRAIFLIIAFFIHGYVRSKAPRLFVLVLLYTIVSTVGLTSMSYVLKVQFATQFLYPILTAIGVMFLVNVTVFPEFGSTHLGLTTIEGLQNAASALRSANALFILGENNQNVVGPGSATRLEELIEEKATLRSSVKKCKDVYEECSFELAYAVIGPAELKPIAVKELRKLMGNVISLIAACESKFALLPPEDEDSDTETEDDKASSISSDTAVKKTPTDFLHMLRPKKEIQFGSQPLLRHLLKMVEKPLADFQDTVDRNVDIITMCLAYAYDVPKLPARTHFNKVNRPHGILLEELDTYIEWLENSIKEFSQQSTEALENAADSQDLTEIDTMPREEVFLISSFLLNVQQAARHTLEMLKEARHLVELRQDRKERRRLHFPNLRSRVWKYLTSGKGEWESDAHPYAVKNRALNKAAARQNPRSWFDSSENLNKDSRSFYEPRPGIVTRIRGAVADLVEWAQDSDELLYASKLTLGAFALSWPAFIPAWAGWYSMARGVWCPLIYILVFEDVVGATVWIFFLRIVGTVLGSVWGFAAYEARDGNPFVIAVMLAIGCIPCFYVQLGTSYQKAGMIGTISMMLISLSTYLQSVPGSSTDNFLKRAATVLIGGSIAMLTQIVIFPAKSRVLLREAIGAAIVNLIKMESCIAAGVDERNNVMTSSSLLKRFEHHAKKAEAELLRSEAYLGFTKTEPRLKGSFQVRVPLYTEIIFVLRQIVERMENLLQLRRTYGNIVLEEFSPQIYVYRRNVAASITLTLFAINEALATKQPLPQFLPSARLAHLRMVIRVRQLLLEGKEAASRAQSRAPSPVRSPSPSTSPDSTRSSTPTNTPDPASPSTLLGTSSPLERRITLSVPSPDRALRLKVLSWNASAAALEECIEYIEELVDLTKLLFGANEFRTGMLQRHRYRDVVQKVMGGGLYGVGGTRTMENGKEKDVGSVGGTVETVHSRRGDRASIVTGTTVGEAPPGQLPYALQRMRSKRIVAREQKGKNGNGNGNGKEVVQEDSEGEEEDNRKEK